MPTEVIAAQTIDDVDISSAHGDWSPTFNSRIRNSDNDYTEVDLVAGLGDADSSNYLQMEYSSFSNVSSTDQVDSLQVSIEGKHDGIQHQAYMFFRVSPDYGSTWCSSEHSVQQFGTTDSTKTITCSHHSWTYQNIDTIQTQFRVADVDENATYYVDYSYLTATYSEIAPNVPTNLAETLNFDNNTIDVSWTASTGTTVVNYTVDYNGTTTTVSGTSTTLTNLDPNTQYVIKVRANGVDNSSAYTSTVTSNYTKTASLADINMTYAPLREDGFCIKWEAITGGVSNWKLVVYDGSTTSPPTYTPNADDFSYKLTGLTKNKRHYFKLVGRNGDNLYDEGGAKVIG